MEKQNKFILASIRERLVFNQFTQLRGDIQLIEMTPVKGFDSYDVIFLSGGTKFIAEIKVRNYESTAYDKWFIQKDKYSYLIERANEENLVPLYINFHIDGAQLWLLDQTPEPDWQIDNLPSDSQYNNQNFIEKEKGDLDSEDAFYFPIPLKIFEAMDKAKELLKKYSK